MSRSLRIFALGSLVLLMLSCLGLDALGMFVLTLAFGWVLFLIRVVPEIRVDWGGVMVGSACLALFAALAHRFASWLYREIRGPDGPGWSPRWTAAMVGVVVLMFVAGISAAGIAHQTGWLLTSEDRLIGSNSSAARRAQSVNNLKQMGLGLRDYQGAEGSMPPAATLDADGRLMHGWQARILPFMEQPALFHQINFGVPWDDPRNEVAYRTRVQPYLNPGVRDDPRPSDPAPSHYAGNAWVLGGDSARKTAEIADGASNTILAGEVAGDYKPWGHPANWRDPAKGINRSPDGFGGPYPGGANFLLADGSVRFLKNTVDPRVFRAICSPDGSEVINPDSY